VLTHRGQQLDRFLAIRARLEIPARVLLGPQGGKQPVLDGRLADGASGTGGGTRLLQKLGAQLRCDVVVVAVVRLNSCSVRYSATSSTTAMVPITRAIQRGE